MRQNPLARVHPDCPNFKWYEVWKSETALRLGIDNESEDVQVQENASELTLHILQPLRDKYGAIRCNSWCRLEELERVITRKSYVRWCEKRTLNPENDSSWDKYFLRKSHPRGQAADIEINGISNDDLFDWIAANLKFDQLIREFPVKGVPDSGWVHVSWRSGPPNRMQIFTIGAK